MLGISLSLFPPLALGVSRRSSCLFVDGLFRNDIIRGICRLDCARRGDLSISKCHTILLCPVQFFHFAKKCYLMFTDSIFSGKNNKQHGTRNTRAERRKYYTRKYIRAIYFRLPLPRNKTVGLSHSRTPT